MSITGLIPYCSKSVTVRSVSCAGSFGHRPLDHRARTFRAHFKDAVLRRVPQIPTKLLAMTLPFPSSELLHDRNALKGQSLGTGNSG